MAYGAFGDIRALLHGAPSLGTWEKLCAEVRLWREPELSQVVFPYVLAQLERWPDELRVIRPAWTKDLLRGRAKGAHFTALARCLHVERFSPDHTQWNTLAALDWRALRHVHLDRVVLPSSRLDNPLLLLSGYEWFDHLDSLTLSIFDKRALRDGLTHGALANLRSLSLRHLHLYEDDLVDLALAPWPRLTELSLSHSYLKHSRRSRTPGSITPLDEDVFAPDLEVFELAHADFGRAALHRLRAAPWLPSLRKLSLNTGSNDRSTAHLFDSALLQLLKSADLSALEHLHLHGVVDARHDAALARNPTIGNLGRLEVTGARSMYGLPDLANRIVSSDAFSEELKSHWRGYVGLD